LNEGENRSAPRGCQAIAEWRSTTVSTLLLERESLDEVEETGEPEDEAIAPGVLVVMKRTAPWVHCLDGGLAMASDLGVGVVKKELEQGKLEVYWEDMNLRSWVWEDWLKLLSQRHSPGDGL